MFSKYIVKLGGMVCAFALVIGHAVSLMSCAGPFYQPKEPEDFNA